MPPAADQPDLRPRTPTEIATADEQFRTVREEAAVEEPAPSLA